MGGTIVEKLNSTRGVRWRRPSCSSRLNASIYVPDVSIAAEGRAKNREFSLIWRERPVHDPVCPPPRTQHEQRETDAKVKQGFIQAFFSGTLGRRPMR